MSGRQIARTHHDCLTQINSTVQTLEYWKRQCRDERAKRVCKRCGEFDALFCMRCIIHHSEEAGYKKGQAELIIKIRHELGKNQDDDNALSNIDDICDKASECLGEYVEEETGSASRTASTSRSPKPEKP